MSTLRRVLLLAAVLPGFCGYVVFSGSAVSQTASDASSGGLAAGQSWNDRLREGTLLELQGSFQLTGDRITFYSQDERRFGALENLNLERVARRVSESTEPLEWAINATVTEFQGVNYLLISRAVLKSKPQRRAKPSVQPTPAREAG